MHQDDKWRLDMYGVRSKKVVQLKPDIYSTSMRGRLRCDGAVRALGHKSVLNLGRF